MRTRFTTDLVLAGYEPEELNNLTDVQIRDLYQEECIDKTKVIVFTSHPNGGTMRRVIEKEAA